METEDPPDASTAILQEAVLPNMVIVDEALSDEDPSAVHMSAAIATAVRQAQSLLSVEVRVTITTVCSIECWYVGRHGDRIPAPFSVDFSVADDLAELLGYPKTILSGQTRYVGETLSLPLCAEEAD